MRRTIFSVFLVFLCLAASAQTGKDIYNRYSGKEGVSAVYVSSSMFNLIQGVPDIHIESGDVDLSGIIRSLDGMYILDVEDAGLMARLAAELDGMLSSGKFEMLMETVEAGEKVNIYITRHNDSVRDFLMIASEPSSLSVISISGDIPFDELQKALASAK